MKVADRYRIEGARPLGTGRTSWVWAAFDCKTEKSVALKILKDPSAPGSDLHTRFIAEAKTTIDHPHVVKIIDVVDENEWQPCIVMELLQGQTLYDKLKKDGKLSLVDACTVVCQIVWALGSAHAKGIVHLDLKPANIFLVASAFTLLDVKVLDFGIAMQAKADQQAEGRAGPPSFAVSSRRGTLGYAAPEQDKGCTLDHRADVFAIGVVLHECLTGERPFACDHWNEYVKECKQGLMLPRVLFPDWPDDIFELVERMLSHDPARRPTDLTDVQKTLQDYAKLSFPSVAKPGEEIPHVPDHLAQSTVVPAVAPPPVRTRWSIVRWMGVSAAAASIAFALAAWKRPPQSPLVAPPPAKAILRKFVAPWLPPGSRTQFKMDIPFGLETIAQNESVAGDEFSIDVCYDERQTLCDTLRVLRLNTAQAECAPQNASDISTKCTVAPDKTVKVVRYFASPEELGKAPKVRVSSEAFSCNWPRFEKIEFIMTGPKDEGDGIYYYEAVLGN